MKGKKLFLILGIALLMLIPTVLASESSLSAKLMRYEPLPAQPGQYVTVYIEVNNIGNEDAENAAIEIIDSFPFSIVNQNERRNTLGSLKSQQTFVADFKLRVNSDAVVGVNKLKIRYTDDITSNQWVQRDLNLEVKTLQASKLAINKVEITPENILPGDEGVVTLTVKNSANIVFRDIALKLNMYYESMDLPFIPVNGVTEKQLSILKPGEISQVSFPFKAYPTATPGYYKIPLTISFYDDEGNEQQQADVIGLIVDAAPELKLVAEHTDSVENYHHIILKTINKGINDLKFLDLEIMDSEDYEIHSLPQNYIGDLDSDDYRTAEFEVGSNKNEFNLKVKASYKDENNKEYSSTIEVPVMLFKKHTENGGISFGTIILILAVIGGVIYLVRRKTKVKKK